MVTLDVEACEKVREPSENATLEVWISTDDGKPGDIAVVIEGPETRGPLETP